MKLSMSSLRARPASLVGMMLPVDGIIRALPTTKELSIILTQLASLLEMQIIGGPLCYRDTQDKWATGIVIIAESHISAHLYPAPLVSHVDVFSCRRFDVPIVCDYVRQLFGFEQMEVHQVIMRGERGSDE